MYPIVEIPTRSAYGKEIVSGHITPGKSIYAKIKRWDDSPTVRWIMKRERSAKIHFAHLIIMPEAVLMTNDNLREKGFTLGDLVGYAEKNIGDLIEEFLPSLSVSCAHYCYSIHQPDDTIGTPHISLFIGHSDLFTKYIGKETDLMIRTDILTADAREQTRRLLAREGND